MLYCSQRLFVIVKVVVYNNPPLFCLPHTSREGFQREVQVNLLFFYILCLLYYFVLQYRSPFYLNIFGLWNESSEFPLFLLGKFALMYKCFGLQACCQNELCLQTKVLLYYYFKSLFLRQKGRVLT